MPATSPYSVFKRIDWIILLPTLALVTVGLLSIYSSTHTSGAILNFYKQIFWIVLGVLLITLIMLAPARFFHYSAPIIYLICISLLVLVLLIGKKVSGNAGWFGFGSFGIQPAEFAKLGTVIGLARFVSDRTTSLRNFPDILKAMAIVFVPWLLILLQPDFGTGLVYWAFFITVIFWAGAEMVLLLMLASPVIIAIVSILNLWIFLILAFAITALYYVLKKNLGVALLFLALNLSVGFAVQYLYSHLPEYQRERVAVFLDPSRAPRSAGYNVIQSKVAVGSGGLAGRGFLQGSQTQLRFVPEQWTDFIFCVAAEEFGFMGGFTVIALYCIILFRGLYLARTTEFRFSSALAIGLITIFAFHIFVNLGMTLGLTPVIGIPLPLMSYGGSFFLTSMLLIGMLLHLYAHKQESGTWS
jgi:rod shape determining protein RodA